VLFFHYSQIHLFHVVKDLAARFADGRLSTSKLLAAEDGALAEMLIEVRGIGRVSSDQLPSSNERFHCIILSSSATLF
jgi:hypothetical protein